MKSEGKENKIDLSALENFEIEPGWVKKKEKSPSYPDSSKGKELKKPGRSRKAYEKREKREYGRLLRTSYEKTKKDSLVHFSILPKREVLQKIKDQMRKTGVSYGLSEVCDTIASKNERYVIKIYMPENSTNESNSLIITKADRKIFTTKEKALNHLLRNHFEKSFNKVEKSEEMPKKNFQYVYECPITKKLLPPNNYHNFKEVINQHMFNNNIIQTFETFTSKLQKTDEAEKITEWTSTPLKTFKFSICGKEETWYDSLDKLRVACLSSPMENLLLHQQNVTVDGENLHLLENPVSEQFKSFFRMKAKWINDLFGTCLVNFKKSNFTIFKFNEKKHTFVSAYKQRHVGKSSLNEISGKIIHVFKEKKQLKKTSLLKSAVLQEYEPQKLLLEIKWLVKEGFITEFSNGDLFIN